MLIFCKHQFSVLEHSTQILTLIQFNLTFALEFGDLCLNLHDFLIDLGSFIWILNTDADILSVADKKCVEKVCEYRIRISEIIASCFEGLILL